MRLVDEQNDGRRRGLNLVDHRAQALFELALHRGARLHQPDVEDAHRDALERRRHVSGDDALGKSFDHRRLADAGLAGQDRVILPAPHQHVDDLTDFFVASEDRIHVARPRFRRQILAETVERRRSLGARRGGGAFRARRGDPRPVHRAQVAFLRLAPDVSIVGDEVVGVELGELFGDVGERALERVGLEHRDDEVSGADLRLAEQQRRVMPAAIERLRHFRRDARHLGLVLAESVDDRSDLGKQRGDVDLVVFESDDEVGTIALQDLHQPVREFDVAVALSLGMPQSAQERFITDPVELTGDGFYADVGFHCPLRSVEMRTSPSSGQSADDVKSCVGAPGPVVVRPVRRHPTRPSQA